MQLQNQSNLIFHISSTLSNRDLRQLARKYRVKYTTKKKTIPRLQAIADELTLLEKRTRIYAKDECAICFDSLQMETVVITRCKHAFCNKCIFKYVFSHSKRCPICRAEYDAAMLMNDKMYFPKEYISVLYTYAYGSRLYENGLSNGLSHAPSYFYSTFAFVYIWKETLVKSCYYFFMLYFYYQCMIISCGLFMHIVSLINR